MNNLCAECNICTFLPEQESERIHFVDSNLEITQKPLILVVDDVWGTTYIGAMKQADKILGNKRYTYTSTIRCRFQPEEQTGEEIRTASQRCAVWTHALLDDRAIILATATALQQMKVEKAAEPGDMFKNPKLGLILCIPPLASLSEKMVEVYQNKVQRLFKEARL